MAFENVFGVVEGVAVGGWFLWGFAGNSDGTLLGFLVHR